MAKGVVKTDCASIRLSCECFGISETYYRCEAKLDVDSQWIAD